MLKRNRVANSALAVALLALSASVLRGEVVLVGSALPQEQGWSLTTNVATPDVTTDGQLIYANTIGPPNDLTAYLLFYKDVGIGGIHYWVEFRVRIVAIEQEGPVNTQAPFALFGSFDPADPSVGDRDMVCLNMDSMSWGWSASPVGQTNHDAVHTYRLEVSGSSSTARVYVDGVLKLTETGFDTNGIIAFGDASTWNNLNSTFEVESITIFRDCNGNNVEDAIDLSMGFPDCNGNGKPDSCDLGDFFDENDCNENGVPDECDLAGGAPDCDGDVTPDECQLLENDCNENSVPDNCDVMSGSDDCDGDVVPDECEIGGFDCNSNSVLDECDLVAGSSLDLNGDNYPDECPIVNPPALEAEPGGVQKVKFISFIPPASTPEATAIRVRFVSLHQVSPPYGAAPTIPFSIFEGMSVWVGPPQHFVESSASNIPFWAAHTQCTPHYRDWTTVGLLHVTGSHIVPSSIYELEQVGRPCLDQEDGCTVISPPLENRTARWADMEQPFNPPSLTVQPDLHDVSAYVNKFRGAPGALIKARAMISPSSVFGVISPANMGIDVGLTHLSQLVDAFRGSRYPALMGKCANSSAACANHTDCGANGPCNLYCTD